jgi:ABC-2 type transport system permease protein
MAVNLHLYDHELKSLERSTIFWAIGLAGLAAGFLCLYPLFANDIGTAKDVIDKFPPTFKQLFDINIDRFTSVIGFFSYLFNFILLAGSIQALSLGLRELSKEETEKTVDFLLVKPLSRSDVVTAKLLAALTSLLAVNTVFVAVSLVTAMLISDKPLDLKAFLLVACSLFLVQLLFLALGFLLATMLKRVKSVISYSMPIVFAFFIVGALGSAIGDLDIARLTPFKFFDTSYILDHNAYNITYVILTPILVIIALATAYWIYRKRNIAAV